MSLIVTSAAARESHRGRHRRRFSNGVSYALALVAVAATALVTVPAVGFLVTVLGPL